MSVTFVTLATMWRLRVPAPCRGSSVEWGLDICLRARCWHPSQKGMRSHPGRCPGLDLMCQRCYMMISWRGAAGLRRPAPTRFGRCLQPCAGGGGVR